MTEKWSFCIEALRNLSSSFDHGSLMGINSASIVPEIKKLIVQPALLLLGHSESQ